MILRILLIAVLAAQATPQSWLARPLANWNKVGMALPKAPNPKDYETPKASIDRCRLTPPRATADEESIEAAGWIPFWTFDQPLVREDIEIVGGMREAGGMCRALAYILFVFVGGKFAG